ncbi:TMV resistance protein N-like [Morus notabilis]|uniref:TMV resistance protein N-like n=1 Tax=Morus notabilis TaxID=981085 RepID=UPI000CECEFCC|nr:TMV resistance protein N-like [Morus notabilis]
MAEASASSTEPKEFDVFLSFRGEDTRVNFTAHLYEALVKNGIETFMDNDGLERGRDISLDLFEAIGKSKSAIVVFSENYADSSWCLDELARIDESKEEKGLIVFPVFCDVDPSHIRKQKGSVENGFKKHEKDFQNEMGKVDRWRKALNRIASVSGWHLTDYRKQYPDAIRDIIRKILEKLHPKDIVGMDSRIRNFEPFLNCRSGEVHKVGIWGTGGIGKTTFAEEVFKRIRGEFQASHFVYRVREECETEDGLTRLRKELDEKLLNNKASMKVLIVLDDVDNATQIEALVGQVGSGSKILITTRDENLLKDSGVRDVYEVEKLNDKEGLQLFCAKAFEGKHYPRRFYEELSKEFVNYADGLPLALEVLGNYLRLHKSEKEWKGELKRLRETPHEGITKVLQFSYDALNYQAKETFLDIAQQSKCPRC